MCIICKIFLQQNVGEWGTWPHEEFEALIIIVHRLTKERIVLSPRKTPKNPWKHATAYHLGKKLCPDLPQTCPYLAMKSETRSVVITASQKNKETDKEKLFRNSHPTILLFYPLEAELMWFYCFNTNVNSASFTLCVNTANSSRWKTTTCNSCYQK